MKPNNTFHVQAEWIWKDCEGEMCKLCCHLEPGETRARWTAELPNKGEGNEEDPRVTVDVTEAMAVALLTREPVESCCFK